MRRRLALVTSFTLLLSVAAACGSSKGPADPSASTAAAATSGSSAAPASTGKRAERAAALLRQLATALRDDRPLGALLDPQDGAWLWVQPGAYPIPSLHVTAGDAHRPSEILAASGWTTEEKASWPAVVISAVDDGLLIADVDGDPDGAKYHVDCMHESLPQPLRALWRTQGIDLHHDAPGIEGTPAEAATTPLGLSFRYGGVIVFVSERDGHLAIAHIVVGTPCDA